MFNLKLALLYLLLSGYLFSCAQSKNSIKNIFATYTVRLPGNIAVDPYGNSLSRADTLFTLYVDAKEEINWESAWHNDKEYSIITTLIPSKREEGTKPDNQKLIIEATNGNNLWQLRLIPKEKSSIPPAKFDTDQILLIGKYHGKKIIRFVSKQIELAGFPSV